MEIRYKRSYIPASGKRYTAGEVQAMLGYAIEIMDPRVPLKVGKLAPGEVCMMIFGITPEEYAWKDSDSRRLDALAEQLRKAIPADRLIGWRVFDLKGIPAKQMVEPLAGASIDDGAFAARVQEKMRSITAGPIDALLLESARLHRVCSAKDAPEAAREEWRAAREKLGQGILGLEKLFVMYDALMDGNWPLIELDGRLEIFTLRERAEKTLEKLAEINGGVETRQIREIAGGEIRAWLRRQASDGLDALRVDNGFVAAELNTGDFQPDAKYKNSRIRGCIMSEVEFGLRWKKLKEAGASERNQTSALESMLSFRNFAWREIGNSKLYAICLDGKRDNCVVLSGKGENNGPGTGEKLLAVFTDKMRALVFAQRLAGKKQAMEFEFDEIVRIAANCAGLVIDIGILNYRLPATEFEKVKELRSKPPVAVRIQQNNIRKDLRQMAEKLPDPDDFKPRSEAEANKAEPAPAAKETEKPARKGFFKKLFGK